MIDRTRLIPIVIFTSSREERDVVNGYQLGVNSYIQKPVDFDKFRETVRQLGWYWMLINQSPIDLDLRTPKIRIERYGT